MHQRTVSGPVAMCEMLKDKAYSMVHGSNPEFIYVILIPIHGGTPTRGQSTNIGHPANTLLIRAVCVWSALLNVGSSHSFRIL